jgi:L-arabinonolactonase
MIHVWEVNSLNADLALDCRNEHGEGILWDKRTNRVWWTDIHGKRLWWLDPCSSEHGHIELTEQLCAFAPRESGGWIMAFASGIELWNTDFVKERSVHTFEPENPETRLNDGRTDRQGRFVVGGMNQVSATAHSSVIRINTDMSVELLIEGVSCANSTCFSPDGSTLYFADTPDRRIRAYDYGMELGDRRSFCDLTAERGLPDGSCVDAEGGVWNASWEGGCVIRIDPNGKISHRIELPVNKATCCAFGGDDLSTLFITTSRLGSSEAELEQAPLSGSLFCVRPGIAGLEDAPFAA